MNDMSDEAKTDQGTVIANLKNRIISLEAEVEKHTRIYGPPPPSETSQKDAPHFTFDEIERLKQDYEEIMSTGE